MFNKLVPKNEGSPMASKRKRLKRHDAIRDIIRENDIKTQQELCKLLQADGHDCTQATISRDILTLDIVKSQEGHYIIADELHFRRVLSDFVEEVHVSGNLIVIRTLPGSAGGVSAALDNTRLPGVLGTVAGDNTIIAVIESSEDAIKIKESLDCLRQEQS